MPVKKKSQRKPKRAVNPALRQVEQLRKSVKVLKLKLDREVKARKLEARIKSEAKAAGAKLSTQLKSLRDQGKKLASELKSALSDTKKRDAARKEALAKIAELKAQYSKTSTGLKAELAQKTAELRRKSEELMKLAGQSAHRAAEIIRSEEHHPSAAEKADATESSYHPEEQSFPEGSGERASRGTQDLEGLDREDDEGPGGDRQ
jgi:chromosome segregation ATPase